MPNVLKTPATLEGITLYKDGSIGLRFSTQEVSPNEVIAAKQFHGHFGTLIFSEAELQPQDIPQEDPEFEGKSPSKRLRNVIYVLWAHLKDNGQTSLKFEDFYSGQIEGIINQYKEKLPSQ